MKIVFMGTPDFAVGALKALIEAGHEIVAVVTQPDKAKGRSGQLTFSPVKEYAVAQNIPVFQPRRIKTPEAIEELRRYPADIFVVVAFGQILSEEILTMPAYGCLNIHASLLPKYRGASPIQHAILNGDEKTGITIQQMDIGVDTGDILYQKEVVIERTDNFESLHDKLMAAGGEAITEALALLGQGRLTRTPQDESLASHVSLITKQMGEIDFAKSAYEIELLVRGMNPWPSAFTFYKGKQLKIWEAVAVEGKTPEASEDFGRITEIAKDYVCVSTGRGILKICSLQLEGKKRMSTRDFLLGVRMQTGERLGR